MKKILLAFDGSNFSKGAFEFVRRLNELQPVLVTGVFMPQVDYANLWSYAAAAGSEPLFVPIPEETDTDLAERNVALFEELCQREGISYRVHKDYYDFTLPELKKETRFADVVIISSELFYKGVLESNRFDYIRDAVHSSECPVVVLPENFEFPQNNILAYDGSAESVYAIKQFAYVFPELAGNNTLLVYAEEETGKGFPSRDYIIELATQHYKDLSFYKLGLDPKKYFSGWIGERRASILVSGAFGRSTLSQIFKKSFVADTIREHQVPVFIAHS